MSHNIGPIPKIVVATTLTFGAVGAAVGGAIDHFASQGIHKRWIASEEDPSTITYTDIKQEDERAKADLAKTEVEVERNVGNLLDEKCSSAVSPYRTGGEFADVSEEGAVSDLMADPKLPCQSWRRQVRAIIRYARGQDAITQQKLDDVRAAEAELKEFEGYKEDDNDFPGALAGGLFLGTIGAIEGLSINGRRKRAEDSNTEAEVAAPTPTTQSSNREDS